MNLFPEFPKRKNSLCLPCRSQSAIFNPWRVTSEINWSQTLLLHPSQLIIYSEDFLTHTDVTSVRTFTTRAPGLVDAAAGQECPPWRRLVPPGRSAPCTGSREHGTGRLGSAPVRPAGSKRQAAESSGGRGATSSRQGSETESGCVTEWLLAHNIHTHTHIRTHIHTRTVMERSLYFSCWVWPDCTVSFILHILM